MAPGLVMYQTHLSAKTCGDRGFEICTGNKYLGGYIGTDLGHDKFATKKVLVFNSTVKYIAMVATQKYPQTAYTDNQEAASSVDPSSAGVPDIAYSSTLCAD